MGDALEKLHRELEVAQRTLAEADARFMRQEAEHQSTIEEVEKARKQIEQEHQKWMSVLNAVEDPIFVHDKDFRVLRCNQAYQRSAGIPYKQIIGQPYYEVFPKIHAPLHYGPQALEKAKAEEEISVGDTTYRSRAYSVMDGRGNYLYSVHTLENINENQRINKALQESEMQYRRLFEAAKDGILILDEETGKIVDANPFILDLLSYRLGECTGKMLWEIGLFGDIQSSKVAFQELQSKGYIRYEDLPLETKDGRRIDVEFVSNLYTVGERKVIQCNIRDITERTRATQLLQASEMQYRRLFEAAQDGILILDAGTGKILDANPVILELLSYRIDECKGKMPWEIGVFKDIEASKEAFGELQSTGYIRYEVLPLETNDGRRIDVELISNLYAVGERKVIQCSIRDITERRRAEAELKESEERFRAIFDHAREGIVVMSIDEHTVEFANKSMEQMLGYGPGELNGLSLPQLHPPDALPQVALQYESDARSGQSNVQDIPMQTKDGRLLYADLSGSAVDIGGQRYMLGMFRDTTERRASELSLRQANRALQTLSAGNLALVRATNEDELLQAVTSVIVEHGGYAQAVVDYAEDDPGKSITPKVWSGYESDRCCAEHLSWADTEQGQFPIAKAIRTGKTQVCHDIASDPAFKPWRDSAVQRGYVSNIALPMSDGKRTFGGLSIYSSEANAFNDEEVGLLEELANDLAYGIVTLRTRKEHEQHAVILRQSLEQSIQTIAATVEARDPYTAGHQRRVGELATAIAREMGMPEDRINGIHLAAIIHDLGKIRVPAEILSKPGKLTDIEYMLIKEHPQDGYDILKDVKFPWPIADMILQHHERMDGSGYPQGLDGEQILLESRILAVADVVEAMSSHRPYRASLGIESALGEIKRGRGSAYDPAVVDACLELFGEKEFAFSVQSS